jgi:predicted metal-dependent phosphoesterase TrpH
VPKFKASALEAIALIHQAGGVAVMAHPGLNRSDEIIPELVVAGLDGIECFHSKHSAGTAHHYQQMAAKHGLLVTGGSDCHGNSKGKPLIGSVKIPYHYVEKLNARIAERKAAADVSASHAAH